MRALCAKRENYTRETTGHVGRRETAYTLGKHTRGTHFRYASFSRTLLTFAGNLMKDARMKPTNAQELADAITAYIDRNAITQKEFARLARISDRLVSSMVNQTKPIDRYRPSSIRRVARIVEDDRNHRAAALEQQAENLRSGEVPTSEQLDLIARELTRLGRQLGRLAEELE